MDLWDLEYAKAGTKKPTKYPRPYAKFGTARRGDPAGRSPEQVMAILRNHAGRPQPPV